LGIARGFVQRLTDNNNLLCDIHALADSLNFLRHAIAAETDIVPPAPLNPYDLLALIFSGSIREGDDSFTRPRGIPTEAYGQWIEQRLAGLRTPNNMVEYHAQRREIL